MAVQRKRTIRLYRITDDGRRLLAGTIQAGEPAELVGGLVMGVSICQFEGWLNRFAWSSRHQTL
jgi:hypothetical protein